MALGISATGWLAAAATVGGAAISADASRKASNTQADATREAAATGNAQFEQTRADMLPAIAARDTALSRLTAGTAAGGEFDKGFTLADFQADPGYGFRRSEGMRGMDAQAGARGGYQSGGALRDLTTFNSGLASQEYGAAYNRYTSDMASRVGRLQSLAGLGQGAANTVATAGADNARTVGGYQVGAGNARASGYVGGANAINSGLSSLSSLYYLNRGNTGGGGGGGGIVPGASGTYDPGGDGGYSDFYYGGP